MANNIFSKISGVNPQYLGKPDIPDETDYSDVDFCQGSPSIFEFTNQEEDLY